MAVKPGYAKSDGKALASRKNWLQLTVNQFSLMTGFFGTELLFTKPPLMRDSESLKYAGYFNTI